MDQKNQNFDDKDQSQHGDKLGTQYEGQNTPKTPTGGFNRSPATGGAVIPDEDVSVNDKKLINQS